MLVESKATAKAEGWWGKTGAAGYDRIAEKSSLTNDSRTVGLRSASDVARGVVAALIRGFLLVG
jgi:hypothetical protein